MAHDPALIDQICELLRKDYEPEWYDYLIEQQIPGTRMYPDVLIIRRFPPRSMDCAVEIGSRGPEKIKCLSQRAEIFRTCAGTTSADVSTKV